MKASAPDGTTYSITRRWMPWRRKVKGDGPPDTGFDLPDFGDDPFSMIVFLVLGSVLLILALPAILLAIGVALEVTLLLMLLPVAVLVRSLFGLPWEVEVRDCDAGLVWPVVHTEQVKGWGASGHRIADLAEEVRLGRRSFRAVGPEGTPER